MLGGDGNCTGGSSGAEADDERTNSDDECHFHGNAKQKILATAATHHLAPATLRKYYNVCVVKMFVDFDHR